MDTHAVNTADTLLDFYAGFSASETRQEQEAAFNTSMQRLSEIEAIRATEIDGELSLDFTPLLLASNVTYHWLLDQLAQSTGKSTEELTFDLRNFIAGQADDKA